MTNQNLFNIINKNYMNRIIKQIAPILLILFTSITFSQNCDGYYPMKKGVSFELTKYDKKDKLESVTNNEIKEVYSEGGSTVAVVHTITEDKHGKETLNAEYNMYCDGELIELDLNTLLKEQMTASLAQNNTDADTEITGKNLVVPNELEVGQSLPETDMNMDIMAGTIKMNFGAKRFNRKVVGTETVTVPAGTFDCVIINEDTELKLLISKKGHTKTWLAKGVGTVKEEEYNKKGELVSHSILTKFQE